MKIFAFMKIHLRLWLITLSLAPAAAHAGDPFLVENGESRGNKGKNRNVQ